MDGPPSISFGPLEIRVHARQFPDASDYWDGNWLYATAQCIGVGSRVKVEGPFLHLGELKKWKSDLEVLRKTLKGEVQLPTIEPNLKLLIKAHQPSTGELACELELTGDQITEKHRYCFDSDQSYLPELISQLNAVLKDFPLR